jgi:hypothetical protein
LLIPQIFPISSVFAPCHPGASPASVLNGSLTQDTSSYTILDLCAYRLTCFNGVPAMRAWAKGRDPDTVFFKGPHFTEPAVR